MSVETLDRAAADKGAVGVAVPDKARGLHGRVRCFSFSAEDTTTRQVAPTEQEGS